MSTEMTAADVRARIRAILGSDEAVGRNTLANHLAFESDCDESTAIGILAVAAREGEAQSTMSMSDAYDRRKAAAGTLGLAPLESSSSGSDTWKKAVDEANARMGSEAVH
ncbi:MAG TPA: hypothetical protein VNS02_04985 [Rhizobiaceae bacterium]|nr:hypothetical protein [Rhizobiaceae bacterium]